MKNFCALSLIISLFFVSCNKAKVENKAQVEHQKTEVQKTDLTTVDSVSVHDSVKINKNLTIANKAKVLVFPTLKNKTLLDSIYALEDIRLDEYSSENLKSALNKQMQDYFDETKKNSADLERDFPMTLYENSDMNIFSNQNDFLTLKYTSDGFSGGAHGYYNEVYKVFDLTNNKTLQLSDILISPKSSVWKRALMDNFLKNDIDKGQSKMLLVKEISPNSNFYFDNEFLYFLYNQYEIAAYAAGTVLIKVPISDIKLMLKPEFIKRAGY